MPRLPLLLTLLLPLVGAPALAGSVTADSIDSHQGALQAAMEQVPRGATVIRNACQDIQVGGFNLPRYRCTVWFSEPPAARPATLPQGAPAAAPQAAPSSSPAPQAAPPAGGPMGAPAR